MNKVKILVLEDDIFIGDELIQLLKAVGYEATGPYSNAKEGLKAFDEFVPDLVLMDIELDGDMDGIATAKEMLKRRAVPIIYVTDHHDHKTVKKAKTTRPAAYIIKPYRAPELNIAIELAFYNTAHPENYRTAIQDQTTDAHYVLNDRIFIRNKQSVFECVLLSDILYLEADRAYCNIHIENRSKIVLSAPLQKLYALLPFPPFMRLHRSFAVNIQKIDSFNGNMVMIKEQDIPIGPTYIDQFKAHFNFF